MIRGEGFGGGADGGRACSLLVLLVLLVLLPLLLLPDVGFDWHSSRFGESNLDKTYGVVLF